MIKKKKIKDVMPEQTKKIEKAEIAELAEIEESKENVADLAKAIIDQQLEEIAESEDIENTSDETGVINPDIAEEHAKRNKSKLSKRHEELKNAYKSKAQVTIKQPEEVEQPKPIQMTVGSTPDNPLIVQKNGREISEFLDTTFGRADGAFMILNERTFVNRANKRVKLMFVEDINRFRYRIYVDLSKVGFIY